MTYVVLAVLGLVWAAVLIPPIIRSRAEVRPADSIVDFRRRLGVLERATPAVVQPAYRLSTGPSRHNSLSGGSLRRREVQHRRQMVLLGLALAVASTFLLGFIPALRIMWAFHFLADCLLAGYVFLLLRIRTVATEKDLKLRHLPRAPQPVAEEALPRMESVN